MHTYKQTVIGLDPNDRMKVTAGFATIEVEVNEHEFATIRVNSPTGLITTRCNAATGVRHGTEYEDPEDNLFINVQTPDEKE